MKVQVKAKELQTFELADTATLADLKKAFAAKNKKYYETRQSFKYTKGSEVVRLTDDRKKLKDYSAAENVLEFKDLGPQIGYRTVFVIEYLGPILIVLLYAMRPSLIYGVGASEKEWNPIQKLAVVMWVAHFLKREYETFFVHRFSRPTMPFFNLFKNSGYYWGFATVVGYPLCHPNYTPPIEAWKFYAGLGIFVVSEISNFICHVMLRNLRPAEGAQQRPIPSGFLFDYVSCPNYTFEVAGWVGFSLMTQIVFSYAFTLVGFLQMLDWAKGKHAGYLKTYGDEYKKLRRKVMIPFVL